MLPARLTRIVDLFARLPGVGEKTAQRFALWLAGEHGEVAHELGAALSELGSLIRPCERCGNVAEVGPDGTAVCSVCSDHRRDPAVLCIVARVQDLLAVERSGAMRGRYFVLGRLLSPLDGIGPEELPLPALMARIVGDGVREVILATPPSVDGEATALLLARELSGKNLKLSRIASGVPHGGDLEFADQITLGRAIDGRRPV
ncbi:MAG TPA: recombination mediator RecR [Polyangiaceae bacterium]|jgi:recombination protein RecR|nr:recombination mediator RecR [Polyangiaceae bacterium]